MPRGGRDRRYGVSIVGSKSGLSGTIVVDVPYVTLGYIGQNSTPNVGCSSFIKYRQVSNIRRTKSQHLKDFHTVLRLSA